MEFYQYPNLSEGADRVGGQLRGDKEYPFSDVTKSGRVWRKCAGKRCSVCGADAALTSALGGAILAAVELDLLLTCFRLSYEWRVRTALFLTFTVVVLNRTGLGKCTHQCGETQGTIVHKRFRQKRSSSGVRRETDYKRRRKQRTGQTRSLCKRKKLVKNEYVH